ncbi:MAG: rubrerythrin family protein [Thermoguttaceae bacterium]
MAQLKGTKTEANLTKAFIGESQARNKYTYYSDLAREQGLDKIAEIFEETANNEMVHARIWFRLLHGGKVPETITNLKDAITGEHSEWTEMYAKMASEAREEGFEKIAILFEAVSRIEMRHEERYVALLNYLEEGVSLTSPENTTWICSSCGYHHVGEKAIQICPVCQHDIFYCASEG